MYAYQADNCFWWIVEAMLSYSYKGHPTFSLLRWGCIVSSRGIVPI